MPIDNINDPWRNEDEEPEIQAAPPPAASPNQEQATAPAEPEAQAEEPEQEQQEQQPSSPAPDDFTARNLANIRDVLENGTGATRGLTETGELAEPQEPEPGPEAPLPDATPNDEPPVDWSNIQPGEGYDNLIKARENEIAAIKAKLEYIRRGGGSAASQELGDDRSIDAALNGYRLREDFTEEAGDFLGRLEQHVDDLWKKKYEEASGFEKWLNRAKVANSMEGRVELAQDLIDVASMGTKYVIGAGVSDEELAKLAERIDARGERRQLSNLSNPSDEMQLADIRSFEDTGKWFTNLLADQSPIIVDSMVGAAAGAAVGSIFPVVGTAIGGGAGFVGGAIRGAFVKAGEKAGISAAKKAAFGAAKKKLVGEVAKKAALREAARAAASKPTQAAVAKRVSAEIATLAIDFNYNLSSSLEAIRNESLARGRDELNLGQAFMQASLRTVADYANPIRKAAVGAAAGKSVNAAANAGIMHSARSWWGAVGAMGRALAKDAGWGAVSFEGETLADRITNYAYYGTPYLQGEHSLSDALWHDANSIVSGAAMAFTGTANQYRAAMAERQANQAVDLFGSRIAADDIVFSRQRSARDEAASPSFKRLGIKDQRLICAIANVRAKMEQGATLERHPDTDAAQRGANKRAAYQTEYVKLKKELSTEGRKWLSAYESNFDQNGIGAFERAVKGDPTTAARLASDLAPDVDYEAMFGAFSDQNGNVDIKRLAKAVVEAGDGGLVIQQGNVQIRCAFEENDGTLNFSVTRTDGGAMPERFCTEFCVADFSENGAQTNQAAAEALHQAVTTAQTLSSFAKWSTEQDAHVVEYANRLVAGTGRQVAIVRTLEELVNLLRDKKNSKGEPLVSIRPNGDVYVDNERVSGDLPNGFSGTWRGFTTPDGLIVANRSAFSNYLELAAIVDHESFHSRIIEMVQNRVGEKEAQKIAAEFERKTGKPLSEESLKLAMRATILGVELTADDFAGLSDKAVENKLKNIEDALTAREESLAYDSEGMIAQKQRVPMLQKLFRNIPLLKDHLSGYMSEQLGREPQTQEEMADYLFTVMSKTKREGESVIYGVPGTVNAEEVNGSALGEEENAATSRDLLAPSSDRGSTREQAGDRTGRVADTRANRKSIAQLVFDAFRDGKVETKDEAIARRLIGLLQPMGVEINNARVENGTWKFDVNQAQVAELLFTALSRGQESQEAADVAAELIVNLAESMGKEVGIDEDGNIVGVFDVGTIPDEGAVEGSSAMPRRQPEPKQKKGLIEGQKERSEKPAEPSRKTGPTDADRVDMARQQAPVAPKSDTAATAAKNGQRVSSVVQTQTKAKPTSNEQVISSLEANGAFLKMPFVTKTDARRYAPTTKANQVVANFAGRRVVAVELNGVRVPFYLSTGHGGKKTVSDGKWYPFFGIAAGGWMNKGTEAQINDYFGSRELRAVAEWLDANIGDIQPLGQGGQNMMKFDEDGNAAFLGFINRDLAPIEHSDSATKEGRAKLDKSIASVVSSVQGADLSAFGVKTESKPTAVESSEKQAAPAKKTNVRTDANGKRTLKKPETVAPAPATAPAPAPTQPANVPQPVDGAKVEKKKTLRRRSVAAAKQEVARAEAKRDLRGESKAGVATAFQQRNAARAARDRALEGKVAVRGVKDTNGKNVRSDAKQGTVSERAEEIAQQSIQIAGLNNATGTDAVLDAARNAIINAEYSSAGPNDKLGAIARIAYETRQRDAAAADALVNNGLSRKPDVNNPITPEEAVAAKPDTIDDLILQSLSPDGPFDTLQEALRIMDSDAAAEAHGPAAVDAVLRAIEPLLDLPVEEVPPAIAERAAALQDRMDRLVLGKSAGSSENQLSKVRAVRDALAAQHPVKDFASKLIGNEDALYSLESELNRRTERASVQDQNIENRGEVSENEDEENPETAQEALMNGVSDREDELDIPDTDIDRTMFASEESLRKAENAGLSSRNMVQSRQRRTTTNGIQRPEEGTTQEIASGAKALAGRDAGAAADTATRAVRNSGRLGLAARIAARVSAAVGSDGRAGGVDGAVQAGYAESQAARGELGRRLERLVRQEAVINRCWAAQGIEATLRRLPRLEETELFGSETSTIFKDPAANQVYKVTRASYSDPTSFWYRMALFNAAFGPDTGVRVFGYGLNELGEFSIIGLQKYVEEDDAATAKLTPQRIFTYLKTVFGPNLRKTGDYAFETPLVTIRDAGPGNVVVDKQGRIRVIDIDIDPKPALKDAMTERFGSEQARFASIGSLAAARLGIGGLSDAERMEREGSDRTAIWQKTGWWRGKDGKWRIEVPIERSDVSDAGGVFALAEFISKLQRFTYREAWPGIRAGYDSYDSGFFAKSLVEGGVENRLQEIIDDGRKRLDKGNISDKRSEQIRSFISEAQRLKRNLHDVLPTIRQYYSGNLSYGRILFATTLEETLSPGRLRSFLADAYPNILRARIRVDPLFNKRSSSDGYSSSDENGHVIYVSPNAHNDLVVTFVHELQHAIQEEEGFALGIDADAVDEDTYFRHAGEVEARNTAIRLSMTPEERAATPPWETQDVADEKQIVRFASDESMRAASSPSGVQKSADVNYPDAGSEISAARFASIGSQRKAEMARLLGKHRPDLNVDEVAAELEKFGTVKEQKAALHWVIRGGLALPQDAYKVADALSVAEKAKVDPFRYKSPDELLLANKDFKPSARPIDPATVPELSDARDEGDGIVSYLVQDDREGQAAMRRIIDTHWGEDANPWCLLARVAYNSSDRDSSWYDSKDILDKARSWWRDMSRDVRLSVLESLDESEFGYDRTDDERLEIASSNHLSNDPIFLDYIVDEGFFSLPPEAKSNLANAYIWWQNYSALPKRVAFKNGRLLAFMATDRGQGDGKVEFSKPENERRVESFYKEYSKIDKDERPGNFQQWMMEEHPEEYDAIAEDEEDGGDAINTYQFSRPAEEWWDRQDESHPDLDWAKASFASDQTSRFANENTLRMAEDLERKYPLMAVHGLSLGSLRKALDEGAFVMPSIAVRNHGDTWRQAGYVDENTKDFVPAAQQVFVLFPKQTITDENTDMFYGDAYTPTINSLQGDYSQENIDQTREEFEPDITQPASRFNIGYLDDARLALREKNAELVAARDAATNEYLALVRELESAGVSELRVNGEWQNIKAAYNINDEITRDDIVEEIRERRVIPDRYIERLANVLDKRIEAQYEIDHDLSGASLVEAKAWRRVPFSEAAAVLIDNSAPKDVERILKYNGVDNVVRIDMADPNALSDAQSTFAPRFASAESLRAAEGGLTGNALSDPNIVRLALGPVRVKNPDGTVSFATKVTDIIRSMGYLTEEPRFNPWPGTQNLRAVYAEAAAVVRKDPAAAERIKEKVLDAYKKYQAGDKNAAAKLSISAHEVQVLRAMLIISNQALVAANDAVENAENNGADNLEELRVAELNAEAQYYNALLTCGFAERAIGTALGSLARLMENDFSMGGLLKKLGDVDGGVTAEDAKKLRGVSRDGEAAQKKHDDAVKAIEEEERKKLVAGKVDDAVGEGRRNKAAGRKAKTVAEAVEAARKELADGEMVDISVYPELWAQIGDAVKGIARAIIGEHLEGPSRLKALDHAAFARRLLAETKKAFEGRITSRDENHRELTERDVLDLFSDYGDPEKLQPGYDASRNVSTEQMREAQSRLKKLSQMMSALEDIKAGKAPLEAYGHLRDLTPKQVDEEMERVKKEMDEAWRASGLDKNLLHRAMSPLELVREGIEKRIAEIKANLAAGELAKKQGRKPIAGEEGLAGLREELKRLQSIQDSVFKNRGLTDEQRLAAIEENYRRTEASAMATLQRLMAGGRPVKPLDMSDDGARSAWATAERAWRQKIGEARRAAADATRRLNELRQRMTPESYRGEKALERAIARREDMTARWEEAVNAGRVTLGGRGIMRDPKMRFDPRLVEADRAYREVIAKRDRLIAEIKYDHAKGWEKLKMNLSAIPNTMRQMLASGDNSGIGVQCAVATLANPKDGIKAVFPGIKVFWNTLLGDGMATERYMESLYRDPDFERIAAYVEIPRTDGKGNFTQNSTEEFFQHGVVADRLQKILHVPLFDNKYMRASEAGFNVPVAMIRFELAKRLLAHLRDMKGEGYTPTNEEMSLLGKVVNAATGRGKFFSGGGPVNLSNVFWASGRVSGQVESLFLPARLFLKHGDVDLAFRKKIARELIWKPWRNFAAAALLFGLAHAIFKDEDDDDPFMELDPTSSKFLRMKVGTRYFDITSGMPSYITLAAKGIWGEKKTVGGKRVALRGQGAFGQSWSNELWRFFRNKLRPEYGNIISLFDGRNAIGEEIEPTPLGVSKFLAVNGFLPLTAKDIVDSIEDFDRNGPLFTASLALLANIGYTTSNFGQTPYKNDRAAIETIDEVRKQAEAGVEGMDDAWSDIALNENNARYIKAASDKQMVKLAGRIKELDGIIRNGETTKDRKSGRVVSRRKLTREERRAAEREKDALEAEYHERLWPELKRIR